jgi:RES domain-containing protein
VRAWRLCQAAYANEALGGEGGLHAPGRWHVQGIRVVYASATLSLAALEMLARTSRELAPSDLVAVELDIPSSVRIERLTPRELSQGWDAYPFPASTQQLGMMWLTAVSAAALAVPSAIIPRECNYLLSPVHPRFARVRIVSRTPFSFDTRLLG